MKINTDPASTYDVEVHVQPENTGENLRNKQTLRLQITLINMIFTQINEFYFLISQILCKNCGKSEGKGTTCSIKRHGDHAAGVMIICVVA